MVWTIEFESAADRDLDKLDPQNAKRILRFLHERLTMVDNPRSLGESLKGPVLGAYWKYRVGDYRIICKIEDSVVRILVVRIGNRREVYR